MKRFLNRILIILIILFTLLALSSCDYFIPAPLGRDNPNDDEVQIWAFRSLQSGSNSVMTVWSWIPPGTNSSMPSSQVIDKIRIVHKEYGRPTTWNPLNKDEVVEKKGSTEWKHEWTNLKRDRDHWFALYPHEKGGKWLSPIYSQLNIEYGNVNSLTPPFGLFYVSSALNTNIVDTTIMNITGTIPGGNVGFIQFNNPPGNLYNSAVIKAEIQGWNVITAGKIIIAPVMRNLYPGMSWEEVSGNIDFWHSTEITVSSSIDAADIKEQINLAKSYQTNALAFIAADVSVNLDITSLTFWDGSIDQFSIWENN